MSTNNSLFLLTVGLLMYGLPSLAPGFFPPHLIYGSNTSALWLAFMGVVQGLLAMVFPIANEAWPLLRPALEWPPQPMEPELPAALIIRPSMMMGIRGERPASPEIAA